MRQMRVLLLLVLIAAAHAASAQPPHPDRFRYSLFGTSRKPADCSKPPAPSHHNTARRDIRCAPQPRPELASVLQKKEGVTIAEPQPEANSPVKISAPGLVGAYARAKPRPTTAALAPIMDGAPLIEVRLCLQADLTLAPCRNQPLDPDSRPAIPPPAAVPLPSSAR